MVKFSSITQEDLSPIKNLQPEGWSDIIPKFQFYYSSNFCTPIKAMLEEKVVGVGAIIKYYRTAWLAHIIVDKPYRNKGIGYSIVTQLLQKAKNNGVYTVSLLATQAGQSIYKKVGFNPISEYHFFERKQAKPSFQVSSNIMLYTSQYYNELMGIDLEIAGEKRQQLLSPHLKTALLYIKKKKTNGFLYSQFGGRPDICPYRRSGN